MAQTDSMPQTSAPPEDEAARAHAELLRSAAAQDTRLAATFEELLGDGGPADETADDMIHAVRAWRDAPSTRRLE
jgi:hypothetical protein